MILTVTLNPCIDRTVVIPGFVYGGTNPVMEARQDVAGKGINVSIALRQLGLDTVCLGFCCSEDALLLERTLQERDIAYDFVEVPGNLRMNIKVFDEAQRVMTELNERGGEVPPEAVERLLEKVDQYLDRAALLVLSGSAPRGVPDDIYRTMIRMARQKGIRSILDASGKLLAEGLGERPFLLKPNRDEFREICGKELDAGRTMEEAACGLLARGVNYVCVSMGAEGALLVGADGVFAAEAPDVDVKGVQGAGDAMVAGICAALAGGTGVCTATEEKISGEEMLRCAVAAAGGSLMHPGTQMCTSGDFRMLYGQVKVRRRSGR